MHAIPANIKQKLNTKAQRHKELQFFTKTNFSLCLCAFVFQSFI